MIQAWDVWQRATSAADGGAKGALPSPWDLGIGSNGFSGWLFGPMALMGLSVLALYLLITSARGAVLNRTRFREHSIRRNS